MEEQGYTFKCGGAELAKVLYFYGYIPDASSMEYKIVCPFHNDINPSMTVDLEKGTYFCFGCGDSGNAFNFVRNVNKSMNDLKAGIEYFRILKTDKCEKLDLSNRTKHIKKSGKVAYDIAHDYFYGLKSIDWLDDNDDEVKLAREYMINRGFLAKTLNYCNAKITYNSSYGLIFPMLDNEKFKGWVCRTMLKKIEAKRKYLYNEGFSRATTLVGNYGKKDYVYIVEGYMDRLKIYQCGEENVVAILGWKITVEQIKKLKDEGINHVISALDNDECGRKGTEYLKNFFTVTRFCYISGVKDPGEMSKTLFIKMNNKTKLKLAQDRRKR